ncbi:general stress protein [Paenibacillus tarimensis]|uniref:general stress protein n=1 Tax=Paenibacillus tarimensis TaxID=416012 RepID=UPI001F3A0F63|nr:general stress protein [Paenibacillus tarimensis]MCF2943515.1 general stress protein [Paenibacillus tarimensis]
MKPTVQVVDTQMAAMHAVRELNLRGYGQDDIYVLAHDSDRTEALNKAADTNEIDRSEEGVFNAMANLFRSRGDELRSKLESVGLNEQEAERYEQELDRGKVLVIAKVH